MAEPPAEPELNHNEQYDVLNYELVYLRYFEACEDYFKRPQSVTGPWTLSARNHIIKCIKANDEVLLLMNLMYNLEPSVLQKYEIVLADDEETLVLTGTSIEILPYEECFDIFVEIHMKTAHGDFDVILKKLENAFIVNDMCLKIFLSNCNLCKKFSLQDMKPVKFNDCVVIEILKAPVPDNECRYILFYTDKATSYLLLRPLIAMDEYEISIEMLKIFTDFGPPLIIKTIHAPLFNNVLTMLQRAGFNYDISIHENDKVIGESYYLMHEIISRVNQDNNYWSTTCRYVQYNYNNGQLSLHDPILNKPIPTSVKPFLQLFGTKHSSKNESVTAQSLVPTIDKDIHEISTLVGKSTNLKPCTIEKYVINSETSGTDTASEAEEFKDNSIDEEDIVKNKISLDKSSYPVTSAPNEYAVNLDSDTNIVSTIDETTDSVIIEENLPLSINQSQFDLNDTKDSCPEMDEQNLSNIVSDNIEYLNSDEIKIEYNPIKTTNPKTHVIIPESLKNMEEISSTSLIVDSIPMKTEPELEESSFSLGNATKVFSVPFMEAKADKYIQNVFSVISLQGKSETSHLKGKVKDDDQCSACNGIMLTDYICYGCKKKTHIFCLSRVTTPLENLTDTINSFTYCKLCLNDKNNITEAVNINN